MIWQNGGMATLDSTRKAGQPEADATDPAQWPEVERRLGPAIASGLAHDERPTARTPQLWLDAIDRLSDERTTR